MSVLLVLQELVQTVSLAIQVTQPLNFIGQLPIPARPLVQKVAFYRIPAIQYALAAMSLAKVAQEVPQALIAIVVTSQDLPLITITSLEPARILHVLQAPMNLTLRTSSVLNVTTSAKHVWLEPGQIV